MNADIMKLINTQAATIANDLKYQSLIVDALKINSATIITGKLYGMTTVWK
jgi:hypothetical protein